MTDTKPTSQERFEYRVSSRPSLPPYLPGDPPRESPIMNSREMTDWLNSMDEAGWEYVSYGQTRWNNGLVQEWWIFRRPRRAAKGRKR